MLEIKLQIGCLALLLYVGIMYAKETQHLPCNKFFDLLLYVAPWAVVFDGFSYLTVNQIIVVPQIINVIVHLLFFITMDLSLIISALYMFDKISGVKQHPRVGAIMLIPGAIAIIFTIACISQLQFLEGEHTHYSMGISVYVSYAAVFLYYGFILCLILLKRNYLPKEKRLGATSFILIVGVLLIMQIIFTEFLVTSLSTTFIVLGIYMEFENPHIRKIEIQNQKMIDNFATLVENRDDNTGGHIKRTRMYVELLLKKMQQNAKYLDVMTLDYIANVSEAAPLHDIGKISTPDAILQKPGKLTAEEFEIMKKHAAKGGEIIMSTFGDTKSLEAKQIAYEITRYHHEKYNGKGYPEGLVGEQIPLHARIMAIADVFDAISQKRCYREAMPLEQCFEIIEKGAGTDFDPELVRLFLENKNEFAELCVKHRD